MRCLLDTNVVSEATKPEPNAAVGVFLERQNLAETFLSVITLGEIEQGIYRLGDTRRAERYRDRLEGLREDYAGRILTLDEVVMSTWGRVTGEAINSGRPPSLLDSLLAATAITHDLILATRNVRDVAMLPVRTLNPWDL